MTHSIFSTVFAHLNPDKKKLSDIFKPNKFDLFLIIIVNFPTIAIWISLGYQGRFKSFLSFYDCPLYFRGILERNVSLEPDLYLKLFNKSRDSVIPPLPGFRFVTNMFYYAFLKKLVLSESCLVLVCSSLSVYLFKRLIVVFNATKNPKFSSLLFCFIPIRAVLFRSVPSYDTFFINCIFLVMIFEKTGHNHLTLAMCIIASLIRFEGILMALSILLFSLIRMNFGDVLLYIVYLIGYIIAIMVKIPNWKTYVIPFGHDGSFGFSLFVHFRRIKNTISNLRAIHSLLEHYLILFIGIVNLFSISFQLFTISILWFCFVLLIDSLDPFRYSLIISILSIIGYDSLMQQKYCRIVVLIISPILIILSIYYSQGQIMSNQKLIQLI